MLQRNFKRVSVVNNNKDINHIFDELQQLRDEYYSQDVFCENIHHRVVTNKWSVAEVVYHCYLLVRFTRQFSEYYLGFAKKIYKFIPETKDHYMANIYLGKTMKAPKILEPRLSKEYTIDELREMIDKESDKIQKMFNTLSKEQQQRIRFPDPIPHYPNVIQTVKLLLIHEKHHYEIVRRREMLYERH